MIKPALAVLGGLALGVAAEQLAVRKPWQPDPTKDEPFGFVRGESHWLRADDGTSCTWRFIPPTIPGRRPSSSGTGTASTRTVGTSSARHCKVRRGLCSGTSAVMDVASEGPQNNTIDQLGRDLQWVINGFTKGPITLVGHSHGRHDDHGSPTSSRDGSLPGRRRRFRGYQRRRCVRQLPGTPGRHRGQGADRADRSQCQPHPHRTPGPAGAIHRLELRDHQTCQLRPGVPNSLNEFTVQMLNATPMETVVDFLPTLFAHDKVHALKAFDGIPALVICGDVDVLTCRRTRCASVDPVGRGRPDPENTGHMIQLERHEQVTEGIRRLAFSDRS